MREIGDVSKKCSLMIFATGLILPIAFFGMALCSVTADIQYSEYHMTLGGVLLRILQGTAPVDMEMREFHVPVVWLMIHLGCVFFTVEYPTRDMNFFGQQIMIRSRNKGRWLLSKYCWNAVSVLIYWLIGYLMVIVFCAFYKTPMSLGVDGNLAGGMDGCDIFRDYFTANVMALRLIFMPFLTSFCRSNKYVYTGMVNVHSESSCHRQLQYAAAIQCISSEWSQSNGRYSFDADAHSDYNHSQLHSV